MQITESQNGSWTVLNLDGKVDNDGSEILQATLTPLLTGGHVALDFTRVEYITSSGFRVLMVALREQTARGGRLLIGNMNSDVRGYFDVAGLSPHFKVVQDIYDVIAAA
jgi:anti-anti-sigma factor